MKSVRESNMTEVKKKNLIDMVYVNRKFMDMFKKELQVGELVSKSKEE
ncbi:hypothetical protein LCGC14_1940160 [marine sediment metagenome]|uniref:Uncharacterized protein n=1 Tax=marine sediment metagenome TaxID=412755 RepID=A0A0F9FKH1_9ZZZZ